MLFAYRDFARDNSGVYEAMIPSPPADDALWIEALDRLQSTTVAVLSGFAFTREEEIHVLRGLRSLAHGFAALESSGAFRSPIELDESFGWLVEVSPSPAWEPKSESQAAREPSSRNSAGPGEGPHAPPGARQARDIEVFTRES